jgi:hypothetical protein
MEDNYEYNLDQPNSNIDNKQNYQEYQEYQGNPENNDQEIKDDIIVPRKRGRPRKNHIIEIPSKPIEKPRPVKDIENREIILRMPLFEQTVKSASYANYTDENTDNNDTKSNDDKNALINTFTNAFTMDESENYQKDETVNLIDENNSFGISDIDDSDLENNDSDDNSIDPNELINELKRKDKLIKQLKNEINELKDAVPSSYTVGKEIKVIPMNISFIHNKNGKTIICEHTDIACWWCTYKFETLPCFIPERYNNNNFDNNFYVFGCFCSFSCAMAYNLELNDYKICDRNSLIKKLYCTITGKNDDIPIAPPKEILQKYGGILTIEEYRNTNNTSISSEYKLLLPPMVNILACIEEKSTEQQTYSNSNSNSNLNQKFLNKPEENNKKKSSGDNTAFNIMDCVGIKEVTKRKNKFSI